MEFIMKRFYVIFIVFLMLLAHQIDYKAVETEYKNFLIDKNIICSECSNLGRY